MPTHPQHQHGLPPRGPGPAQQQRNGLPSGAASLTRSPMPPDYGRSPTPGSTPSRTPARRLGTSQFRYYTLAQLEAMSKRQGTRASGWNAQLELKRRRNYVEWIHALCKCLGLPYVVIETAIFYMHRYFAFKSMADTDIWVMSLAAVFAASKSEDNPRALQDILYTGLRPERVGAIIKPARPKLFQKTKTDPQKLEQLRESALTAERALLYTMGFNFAILHPQVHILNAVTHYKLNRFSHLVPAQPGIDDDVRMTQQAVQIVNFSHNTTLSLQYPPQTLGLGCLYFVFKHLNCEPMWEGKPWWVDAGASEHELEDIRQQITVLLNPPASAAGADAEDDEPADGVAAVAVAAAAKASGAAAATQQSAEEAGQPQDGGADLAAPFSPVFAAPTPDVLHDAAIHPQPSLDSAELVAAVNVQLSPDENRSDASDTTGAGQGSPTARPGFSPVVVEGHAGGGGGGLAGSKRRSPDAADTGDAQPAKRADTGPDVEQPAAGGGSNAAGEQSVGTGPGHEQTSAGNVTGVSPQAAAGVNGAVPAQQPAAQSNAQAAGDSPPNRPAVQPAQPGIATAIKRLSVSPLHPDVAASTGAAANGGAVADSSRVTGRPDAVAATAASDAGADDTIMSQDSAEPGEIVM